MKCDGLFMILGVIAVGVVIVMITGSYQR